MVNRLWDDAVGCSAFREKYKDIIERQNVEGSDPSESREKSFQV